MFKKIFISIVVASMIAIVASDAPAPICRTWPYCVPQSGSVDSLISLVTKYANKENVAVYAKINSTAVIPDGIPWPSYIEDNQNSTKGVCINPGSGEWTPPGNNPPSSDAAFSGVTEVTYWEKNGKAVIYVNGKLDPGAINVADWCPNNNWELDLVPEYLSKVFYQEIIVKEVELADGTIDEECYEASNATYEHCFIDLDQIEWNPETLKFTEEEYECNPDYTVLVTNKTPIKIDCPWE